VSEGRFRADLYFRLNVFPLRVPALREHVEDLAPLADRFLSRLRGGAKPRLSAEVRETLEAYPWPGNVRELQNVLEYAALRAGAGEIGIEHLPADVREAARPRPRPPEVARDAEEERRQLVEALERTRWNRTRAAEALGVSRVTLWKRMKRHGLLDRGAAR
jgi:transcriptional regulator of acetoin/glycerol metabolism